MDGHRLFGTMQIGESEFDISGTASTAGVLSLVGDGIGTTPGGIQGLYRLEPVDGGAAALLGSIQNVRDGTQGSDATLSQILLRQLVPDPSAGDAPSVAGDWTRTFVSGIDGESNHDAHLTLEMSASGQPTQFHGWMLLPYIEQENLWKLVGSVAITDGTSNTGSFVMLAVNPAPPPTPPVPVPYPSFAVLEGAWIPGEPPPLCNDDVCPEPENEPARVEGVYRI